MSYAKKIGGGPFSVPRKVHPFRKKVPIGREPDPSMYEVFFKQSATFLCDNCAICVSFATPLRFFAVALCEENIADLGRPT